MHEHAMALADAIEAALPGWVERSVERVLVAAFGTADPAVMAAAAGAGERAKRQVGPDIRALLELDIDLQRTTPLALLRAATRYPTEVLRAASVPPVDRDPNQERLFPDDVYDLAPARFGDISPEVGDLGLVWGAAKAHTHLQRHARAQT